LLPRSTLFPYTTLFRSLISQRKIILPVHFHIPVNYHRFPQNTPAFYRDSICKSKRKKKNTFLFPSRDPNPIEHCLKIKFLKNLRSEEHTSELQSRENLV